MHIDMGEDICVDTCENISKDMCMDLGELVLTVEAACRCPAQQAVAVEAAHAYLRLQRQNIGVQGYRGTGVQGYTGTRVQGYKGTGN